MPSELRTVEVFDALAIKVNLKIVGETRNPLDDASLCPVAFVKEGRNDR